MAVLDDDELTRDEYYREHLKTYTGFMTLMKYATIAIALVLIGMAIFLL